MRDPGNEVGLLKGSAVTTWIQIFFFMLSGLSLCSIEHHHYMVLKILFLNYFKQLDLCWPSYKIKNQPMAKNH